MLLHTEKNPIMPGKAWTLAVWMEEKQEEEGVIPTCWIEGDQVRWPSGSNAIRALNNRMDPGERWLSFRLIKIKHQSNQKEECEDFNFTTTTEASDSEFETSEHFNLKRVPKKRTFSDFVSDHDSSRNGDDSEDQRNTRRQRQESTSTLPPVPRKQVPNSRQAVRHLTSCVEECLSRSSTPAPSPPPRSPSPLSSPDASPVRPPVMQRQRVGSGGSSAHQTSGMVSSTIRKPDASPASGFPMSEARFQRRVLFLLSDIRDSLKKMQDHPGISESQHTPSEVISLPQASCLEEFRLMETNLAQENYRTYVVSSLQKMGGFTFKDNLKKGMSRWMTNGLMAKVNLAGHGDKLGFRRTKLCSLLVETITDSHKVTENEVYLEMGKYLKNAPGRCGGGGRSKDD